MFRSLTAAFIAMLLLGSTSFVRAESGTDAYLDNSRSSSGYQETLTTKPVALQKAATQNSNWMDHASQVTDGGN